MLFQFCWIFFCAYVQMILRKQIFEYILTKNFSRILIFSDFLFSFLESYEMFENIVSEHCAFFEQKFFGHFWRAKSLQIPCRLRALVFSQNTSSVIMLQIWKWNDSIIRQETDNWIFKITIHRVNPS